MSKRLWALASFGEETWITCTRCNQTKKIIGGLYDKDGEGFRRSHSSCKEVKDGAGKEGLVREVL